MTDLHALRREFTEGFGGSPRLFRAPGRVNLIGEHTDYNAGWVMPAAIQFDTTVAIAPRADAMLRVRSTNFAETLQVPVPAADAAPKSGQGAHWIDYVLGVAHALRRHGVALPGADLLIHGEVPLGSGLSSSAALEVSVALAWSSLAGSAPPDRLTLAKLCQSAENDYVGMRCGIMDQFASACGIAGHALLLDCRSLEHQPVPLGATAAQGPAPQIVICNTMVRHRLAGGEFNRRRRECEEGVRALAGRLPGIRTLRDLSPALLRDHEDVLGPMLLCRCRHVVSENDRVVAAAAALRSRDLATVGRLMGESHRSLRDDYEVSCDELDLMVRLAEDLDGVYGARMTGGGFGGCTVNLVRADAVPRFAAVIAERYAQATGHRPEVYVCAAAAGAGAVDPAAAGEPPGRP
jgi:galactokinase